MKLIGLVVGHSQYEQGCTNITYSVTEYAFNCNLVSLVRDELTRLGYDSEIFFRTTSLKSLPPVINKSNPDLVVSFHCNAFNTEVSGSEVLYYKHSHNAKRLASILQKRIVNCLGLPDRGIKAVTLERGSFLLKSVNATACLLEPFFLDHDPDYITASDKLDELAIEIAQGIVSYFG